MHKELKSTTISVQEGAVSDNPQVIPAGDFDLIKLVSRVAQGQPSLFLADGNYVGQETILAFSLFKAPAAQYASSVGLRASHGIVVENVIYDEFPVLYDIAYGNNATPRPTAGPNDPYELTAFLKWTGKFWVVTSSVGIYAN